MISAGTVTTAEKRSSLPTMPKRFGHTIHDLAERDANGGAFVLGAATFFLPCGFTQALQLYVLAKGSFTAAGSAISRKPSVGPR